MPGGASRWGQSELIEGIVELSGKECERPEVVWERRRWVESGWLVGVEVDDAAVGELEIIRKGGGV